MNHKAIYADLCEDRQFRGRRPGGTYEKHHVIPKALGGTNDPDNIVYLTPREHFLAHWLLVKFCTGEKRHKMLFAMSKMVQSSKNHERIVAGWQYEIARKAAVEAARGNKWGAATKGRLRGPMSAETRAKMSAARRGVKHGPMSKEHKASLSASHLGIKYVNRKSPALVFRAKMSVTSKTLWRDPKHRAKVLGARKTPEALAKLTISQSAAKKRMWQDPVYKERQLAAQKRGRELKKREREGREPDVWRPSTWSIMRRT